MTQALTLTAPAKVNLWLEVVGRRADGLHLLDSLFCFAAHGDRLQLAPAPAPHLRLEGRFAAALEGEDPAGNLVLRAARMLAEAAGRDPAVEILLDKRLPVGAGLGGGSADAAAVLGGLVRLWRLAPDAVDLPALGLRLGADVPACLAGKPVHATGVGEVLQAVPPLPPHALLLVHPGRPLLTAQVFGRFRLAEDPRPGPMPAAWPRSFMEMLDMARARRNDLTAAAIAALPAVGEVLAALAGQPGCGLARMSGSGSACFGLFADLATARAAEARLRLAQPGWWVQATLPRPAAQDLS